MNNLYLFSKKIHRYLVIIIMSLGLLMTISGSLLKFPKIASEYLTFINMGLIRYLHNQLSTYFGIVLFLMILTGAWMYFYPMWKQKKNKADPDSQNPPNPGI
ncbi:MAG: PepSY domain-containing protein [Patescibacteria group bacterium]